MIDWLRRFRAKKPLEVEVSRDDASEKALRAGYRQAALHLLSQDDGLMPVYRRDVRSPEDFEEAANEMPLIVVWGERLTDNGVAFSISVNIELIWDVLTEYMDPRDPWLEEECGLLLSQLKSLTERTMSSTVSKTGLIPSKICEQLAEGQPGP